MPNKLTAEEFIERAKKVHGDKYDYSLVEYVNSKSKVKIICPVHGIFEQRPNSHLNGNGCPECKNDLTGNRSRKTKEDFIKKAIEIHGYKYDYSLVEYKNRESKVRIICPVHGVFEQSPHDHLSKRGCPKCAGKNKTNDDFVKQLRNVHGNKYDYSLVEYTGAFNKIKIICPVHGVFEQSPHDHLKGCGCIKCSGRYRRNTEDFIERAKKVHGDKYDYSLVDYKNANTKVKIICHVHGIFEQRAIDHLRGTNCPKCNEYSTEMDIEKILQKENIKNITQKTFKWLIYEKCMKLDFYIPIYNVAIECQGIQHFEPVELFGGVPNYEYTIDHDQKKRELCEQHGIKVFYYANYQYDFPYKVYTDPEELIAEIKKIDPINKI